MRKDNQLQSKGDCIIVKTRARRETCGRTFKERMNKKLGNSEQLLGAYEIELKSGEGSGKRFIIVDNGRIEVWFSVDNAMDITKASYKGYNLSFLSKNGINKGRGTFEKSFEGGFLYSCGLDNVNVCREGYPVHGSLHGTPCSKWQYAVDGDNVIVTATVKDTALFKQNLTLKREYRISENKIELKDFIINDGYTDAEFCLLYHINWGYSMLSPSTEVRMERLKTEGLNAFAQADVENCLKMTEPEDGLAERCYYHTLKEGKVELFNPTIGVHCRLEYDCEKFPYLVEWKSMGSGDYALGTEPSTTRFDDFKTETLKSAESRVSGFSITFGEE